SSRDVVDHSENEREDHCRESRNRAIFTLGFRMDGNSCERREVWQRAGVQYEQDAIHIAKTLVVLVNKLTLGAPFHATLLIFRWLIGPAGCGRRSECAPQGSRVHPDGAVKQDFSIQDLADLAGFTRFSL